MNKLNNREIAELLKSTFADAAPDQKESIIKAAESHSPAVTVSVTQENTRGVYIKRAALIAASFLIVFGVIFTLILINANKICSTVLVESDSCVEIALNRDRRPVSINAVDNAAAKLVQKIDKGASLSQAVDNILDTMQENGNLTEDNNTILITADDPEDASDLLKESFNAAKESFDDADFSGAILTTVASDDKKVNQLSHRHHISVGKAEMIRDIIRTDSSLSAALLSRLSVNDLNLLTSFRRIRYQDIDVFGTSRGCMDPSDIISYVCMEAGASPDDAVITLGVSQYGLVYSVTVYGESRVYIYRLDAENGEVLAVSQGRDLETAQMADRNTPTPAPSQKKASSATTKATAATDPENRPMSADSGQTVDLPTAPAPTNVSPTTPADDRNVDRPEAPEKKGTIEKPSTLKKPKQSSSTTAPRNEQAASPAPVAPTTAPLPTAAPQQASTTAPTPSKPDPAIFTADTYLRYNGGIQSSNPLTSSSKRISIRRILNGYNTFYDNSDFPYSPAGKQGGISALVCNREQLRRLTGSRDNRFDDTYFKTHALYIHMNRDVNYHWIKSVNGAYMNGGTLCIENSEPVGYYITTNASNPEQIYTVVYELNKSDLTDFKNMVEFTD